MRSRPKLTEIRTGRDRGVSSRNDRARPPETTAALDRAAGGHGQASATGADTDAIEAVEVNGIAVFAEVTQTADSDDLDEARDAGDDTASGEHAMGERAAGSRAAREKPAVSAYGRALGLLGRREHSRRELKDKLAARGLEDAEIDAALVTLDDKGFQSDRRFADMLARSRIAQGHGPIRILAELRLRGIDAGTAQDALDEQDADWSALAGALCQRRFRGRAVDHAEKVRRANFLARRGFPAAIARAAANADNGDNDGE